MNTGYAMRSINPVALSLALLLTTLISSPGADPGSKVFHDLALKIGKKTADTVFQIPVPQSAIQNCSSSATNYQYHITGTLTVDTSVIGGDVPPKVMISALDRRVTGKLDANRRVALRVKLSLKTKPDKDKTKPPVYEWVFDGFTLKVDQANCK